MKMVAYNRRRRILLMRAATLPLVVYCLTGNALSPITIEAEKFQALEKEANGRIGLYAWDTGSQKTVEYRANERFQMASTFKAMLVGAVLHLSMADEELLNQRIYYSQADLVGWSPITEKHVSEGMLVGELCAAIVQYSDNAAANLLLRKIGGPLALTNFMRSIGDDVFRLDRYELELNTPNEEQWDTSSPAAMAKSLYRLALGDVLAKEQQQLFQEWLKGNTTGSESIRAGVPQNWVVGDKTGSGPYGITNDIAVLWPDQGAPVVMAIYFVQRDENAQARRDVLALAAHIAIEHIGLN